MKSLQDLVEETQQSLANSLRPVTGFFEIGVPVSENTPESQWADNYAAYETLLALYGQTLWAEINNGIEDHPRAHSAVV